MSENQLCISGLDPSMTHLFLTKVKKTNLAAILSGQSIIVTSYEGKTREEILPKISELLAGSYREIIASSEEFPE